MRSPTVGQLLLLCLTLVSFWSPVSSQTFPPFNKCNQVDCNAYAAVKNGTGTPPGPSTYTDARSLHYCCQMFRKCCTQAKAIPCPPDDNTTLPANVTEGQFQCSGFGPYCSKEVHCGIGQKCCRNPLYGPNKQPAPGTATGYSCCWTVVKQAVVSAPNSG